MAFLSSGVSTSDEYSTLIQAEPKKEGASLPLFSSESDTDGKNRLPQKNANSQKIDLSSYYHKAEFSCADDFPYAFAQKLIWLPWLVLALCWLAMITCSAGLLVSLWLALAVFSVYYTIIIMKPQIGSMPKEIGAEEDEVPGEDDADESLTDEAESVRETIRRRVIEIARSRYLEPHLTRRDIVGMFDFGERTIAGQIITSYGFYDMINTLRLHHARLYQELHPDETKESAAIRSGFKDRFAMRHAERRITLQHPEILDGFRPNVVT